MFEYMNNKWNLEKENLIDLIINQKKFYEEIGKLYGCTGANIKKVALRLGIELEHRRKINDSETFSKGIIKVQKGVCKNCGKEFPIYSSKSNIYCSNECQQKYQHKEKYQLLINGDESIMRGNYNPYTFKQDILNEQNGVCAICECKPEHNNKPLVFILDHIDGNAANNKRDNLRCICPNCDSQLDTYKSKNKNGARSYYRYHKFEKEE